MKNRITNGFITRLTDSNGKAKTLPEKDSFIRDTGLIGFGIKITPTGNVSFIFEGRIRGGKSKRLSLGRYPVLSLDAAKKRATDLYTLMREGVDPTKHQQEQQSLRRAEEAQETALQITLKELMEDYLGYRHPKTEKEYSRVINSLFSDWLNLPVRSITGDMVAAKFQQKAIAEGHRAQALKGNRYLKAICSHGQKKDIQGELLLDRNPVAIAESLLPRDATKPVPAKERTVPADRLFDFIRATITECHSTARDVTLLQLFTGLRDQEAKGMKWADVDFEKKTLTARETKGKKDHTLPMGSLIYAMLLARFNEKQNETFVFPNRSNTGKLGDIRKQLAKITQKTGIEFSPHDLRRSFSTYMAEEIGVSDDRISRLLNHAPINVAQKHYIKSKPSNYVSEANKLYSFISFKHDWSRDDGEGIDFKQMDDDPSIGFEKAYLRSNLHAFLYRDSIISGKADYDKKYIDDWVDIDNCYQYPEYFGIVE